MSYLTAAALRLELGIPATTGSPADVALDAMLTSKIADASALWDAETGTTFEAATDTTHTLNAQDDVDGPLLYLRHDLAAVTSVVNGDTTTVSPSDYVLLPTQPRKRGNSIRLMPTSAVGWTYTTNPVNAISVTGKWAYSVTPPTNVVTAVRTLAAWLFKRKEQPGVGEDQITQISPSGVVLTSSTWPREVRLILDLYRPVFGNYAGARVVRGQLVTSG